MIRIRRSEYGVQGIQYINVQMKYRQKKKKVIKNRYVQ